MQAVRRAMSWLHGADTVERAGDASNWRRLPRAMLRLRRLRTTAAQRRSVRRQRLTDLLPSRLREEIRRRRLSAAQSQVRRLVPLQV